MKYPVIEQSSINDCGPASLYMLINYYGTYISLNEIKNKLKINSNGTSMYDLKESAVSLGFKSNCYKTNIDYLNKNKIYPFIAHTIIEDYYHYQVVYKINEKYILVADPSDGMIKKYTYSSFNKIFTGNILILEKKLNYIKKSKEFSIKQFINKKEILKLFIYSFILLFIELIVSTSIYILIKNIHLQTILIFTLLIILKKVINHLKNIKASKLLVSIEKKLKEYYWMSIFKLPLSSTIEKEEVELTLERIDEVTNFYLNYILSLLFDIPIIILLFILLFINKLYLIIFILVIKNIYFYFLILKDKNNIKKIETSFMKVKHFENDIIYNIDVINETHNVPSKYMKDKYKNYFNEKRKCLNISNKITENFELVNDLFNLISITIIIFLYNQNIELIILIYQLLNILDTSTLTLINNIINKNKINLYIEKLILSKKRRKEKHQESIIIHNGYFNEFIKLKKINVTLFKGDSLLLYGDSGSGKTTLTKIIRGIYEMKGYKSINPDDICYINSKPYIIGTNLNDNLCADKDILSICKCEKLTNKNINTLSSGEKQKLTLAKTLTCNFNILILDEALNQIEEEEEKEIIKEVKKYLKDKIIIVITHRKNLESLFSNIAFIKGGKLKYMKRRKRYD